MAESQHIHGNLYHGLTIGGDSRAVVGNVHGDVHFNAVNPKGSPLNPEETGLEMLIDSPQMQF